MVSLYTSSFFLICYEVPKVYAQLGLSDLSITQIIGVHGQGDPHNFVSHNRDQSVAYSYSKPLSLMHIGIKVKGGTLGSFPLPTKAL